MRTIVSAFHCYTPKKLVYYQPIYDFFIKNLESVKNEFDNLYILNSNWQIGNRPEWAKLIKTNPNIRYYDAYKKNLQYIEGDYILFLDNDMVIYQSNIIDKAFSILERKEADVVSIYDTIGSKHFDELHGQSKFCPYFFASSKDVLLQYVEYEWGPVPWGETLSEVTEKMLKNGLRPYEFQEDKSNFLYEQVGVEHGVSKNLGYYHVRAGSTAPVLLFWREEQLENFKNYIESQPQSEYLRHFAWYWIMGGSEFIDKNVINDLGADYSKFLIYVEEFKKFHGL